MQITNRNSSCTKRKVVSPPLSNSEISPPKSRAVRFFEPIFVSLGGSKNLDSTLHASCFASLKLLNQQQNDSRQYFTVNLTVNTVKYDSSAPSRQWRSYVFAKHFRRKCRSNDFNVDESTHIVLPNPHRSCRRIDLQAKRLHFAPFFFRNQFMNSRQNSFHCRRQLYYQAYI